ASVISAGLLALLSQFFHPVLRAGFIQAGEKALDRALAAEVVGESARKAVPGQQLVEGVVLLGGRRERPIQNRDGGVNLLPADGEGRYEPQYGLEIGEGEMNALLPAKGHHGNCQLR